MQSSLKGEELIFQNHQTNNLCQYLLQMVFRDFPLLGERARVRAKTLVGITKGEGENLIGVIRKYFPQSIDGANVEMRRRYFFIISILHPGYTLPPGSAEEPISFIPL
jgi:hypothetical protein